MGLGSSLRNVTLREAGESEDLWVVTVFGLKGSEFYHIGHESAVQVPREWFLVFSYPGIREITVLVSGSVRILKCNMGNYMVPATG